MDGILGKPIVKLIGWIFIAIGMVAAATWLVIWVGHSFSVEVLNGELAPKGRTFDEILHAIEAAALLVAALQIVILYGLGRSEAKWRKLLSYHQFFSDCPANGHRTNLMELMHTTGMNKLLVGTGQPLSNAQARTLFDDSQHLQVVKLYLDGFEQLAVAIRCRVVDEGYAFHIEATRIVRAFKIFRPLIHLMQQNNPAAYVQFSELAGKWTSQKEENKSKEEAAAQKLRDKNHKKLPKAD